MTMAGAFTALPGLGSNVESDISGTIAAIAYSDGELMRAHLGNVAPFACVCVCVYNRIIYIYI